jgi:hypothetical protein
VRWSYEQESRSLADWIRKQRNLQNNNKIRLSRKRLLDEIGFAWKDEDAHNHPNHIHSDKICHQHYEQLETTEPARGHGKRSSTCVAESGQMGAGTKRRDKATASSTCSYVEDCHNLPQDYYSWIYFKG